MCDSLLFSSRLFFLLSPCIHAFKIFLYTSFVRSFVRPLCRCASFSFFLFSSLLSLSQTHTYILVPFIIHDLLAGRRLYLRRFRHSWLCVLEPSRLYVEKRLFFSSVVVVVYPLHFFLSLSLSSLCLFSRHSLYDDTSTFVH